MGSYSQLAYHIIFATKYRRLAITDNICERLYEYIGGTLRTKNGQLIEIGGTQDHIHILTRLSPSLPVADIIRTIKANSSRWMNEQPKIISQFEWQKGYSAFTVSYSQIGAVKQYIRTQKDHHTTKTFQEEYVEFLRRHHIDFRIEHLFENEHHG